jgi:hypothetical protein
MASWMNKFYMDDVQWKLPQLFYFRGPRLVDHVLAVYLRPLRSQEDIPYYFRIGRQCPVYSRSKRVVTNIFGKRPPRRFRNTLFSRERRTWTVDHALAVYLWPLRSHEDIPYHFRIGRPCPYYLQSKRTSRSRPINK